MASAPPRFCGECGAPLAEGASFCGACGTAVAAQPAAGGPEQPAAAAPEQPAAAPPAPAAGQRGRSVLVVATALGAIVFVAILAAAFLVAREGGERSDGAETFLMLVPSDASDVAFLDLDPIRDEPEFRLIVNSFDDLQELEDQFGLRARDLSQFAVLSLDGDSHMIVSARGGDAAVRSALRRDDFIENDADSAWYGRGHYEAAAALGGGRYAFAYLDSAIEDFIDTRDGARSLGDDRSAPPSAG